jgi:hypothetical protein
MARREALEESINRSMHMHLDRFPKLSSDIIKAFQSIHELKSMGSMRALQFAGNAALRNHCRTYNCSYRSIDDVRAFGEALFLLLSGTGFGYSVQRRHIIHLPVVQKPREEGQFVVQDSIIGWAQALDAMMEAYFFGRSRPLFDFTKVRAKGSYLVTTGAKAPGPEPLRQMLRQVEEKLKLAEGRKLTSLEVHDIVCITSECVLAGGIRRAACICLFDRDDREMLTCKSGEWWKIAPWRARANNSAIMPRQDVTKEEFLSILKACKDSGAGEPGVSWTNDPDYGYNPCVTGDTEILTREGYKRIDSLVDTQVDIWNGFEWSLVTPKITGRNQPLVTVTFSSGRSLNCTDYHRFEIATDYHGGQIPVRAKDLMPGMKLIKHNFPVIEGGISLSSMYLQGFFSAEGMDGYGFLWVYDPKKICLDRLSASAGSFLIKSDEKYNRTKFSYVAELRSKTYVPFEGDIESKLDWLAGLFDGDGCELKEGGLQLGSVDRPFLLDLQKMLTTIGVASKVVPGMPAGVRNLPNHKGGMSGYFCKESFRLCIGAVQIQNLKELGLRCERLVFNKTPQRDASQFVTVVDVTEAGVADVVYCFDEPKRHLGTFNGIVTGQCHEISLQSQGFCNLSTVNVTGVWTEKEYLRRIWAATLLGTLQASYTDFPYLTPKWKQNAEEEALLGVSMTGVADNIVLLTPELLEKGAKYALEVNEKYSKKIGTRSAKRVTAIKPEGTSSCVLMSASGIHDRHAPFYLRRIRMNKEDSLAKYLKSVMPTLVEDDLFSTSGVVVTFPQASPEGAVCRGSTSALQLLDRALLFNKYWVAPGHREGPNKNNVSCTISVRENEWDALGEGMWENREYYSGISLLPFDGGSYQQAPFEECSEETYVELLGQVKNIDLRNAHELEDCTELTETVACAGGACEWTPGQK